MKKKEKVYVAIFVLLCIGLNFAGKRIADHFYLPIWLDSIGTILSAYVLGPVCGGIVGAALNLIYGTISSSAYIYAISSVCIGVAAGCLARRNMFESYLKIASVGMLLTLVSIIISIPLNIFLNAGMTGNIWGDGVIEYLQKQNWNNVLCSIIGEFYVDFLDKIITVFIVGFLIRMYRKLFKGKRIKKFMDANKTIQSVLLVVTFGMLLNASKTVQAVTLPGDPDSAEKKYSSYVQTVYNEENGIPGGEVNDMSQTRDGLLWIGTYGGLYKYDGTSFVWMDNFSSVRNVNCLYTDVEGRLWIGTNDGGLSICSNSEIVNVLDEESGLPSNSVRSITRSQDGSYYVGTSRAMAMVSLVNGVHISGVVEEVVSAVSSSADSRGYVACVDSAGKMFLLKNGAVLDEKECNSDNATFTSVCFDKNDNLYISNSNNEVELYEIKNGKFEWIEKYQCGTLTSIKSLSVEEDEMIYICADNGAGYLNRKKRFYPINTGNFNSSIENMLMDYQNNLWFSSSRLGLLKLCDSSFTEVYYSAGLQENVVNSVIFWNGSYYFGTDSGLDKVGVSLVYKHTDTITKALDGIRIRCLMKDSQGNLWVSTFGSGVWKVDKNYEIEKFDSQNGTGGDKFRSTIELSDGTIAAAGDHGITFINKMGKITSVITQEEGLVNPRVLCMLEGTDGTLYAGTDGNGIAVIRNGEIADTIKRSDGLSSDVILRMVMSKDEKGFYAVQSNGISLVNKNGIVKNLDNIPYYNNYDMIRVKDSLWIPGSAGIYIVDEQQLLSGEELDYEFLDSKRGLRQSLTANSWNYMTKNGLLFLSGDTGAVCVDTKNYSSLKSSYRICISDIKVDGVSINVSNIDETTIGKDSSKLEIHPMVINYTVNNPYVSVYLEGYDEAPQIMQQSELSSITYSNLSYGTYVFHLAVLDNKKQNVIEESTFRITKEANIYEHTYFMVYLILVLAIFLVYLTSLFIRNSIQRTLELQKKEIENLKLQQDAEAANTASKVKSDFLAQMSHEIRTPINAVLGMNELILRETTDSEIYEYATNIDVAGRNLLTLINGILDFSKIEDGKMEIIPVEYNTATFINNISNSIAERAKAKGLRFNVKVDESIPEKLYGDDIRITQVISNLLTNAVKYTESGTVTMTFSNYGISDDILSLYVEVADTGSGIREEDISALFESFRRLNEKKNRHIEGTGLGMSIVTKLLEMMESELQVKSVYGEGSVFSFILKQKIISCKPVGNYKQSLKECMSEKRNENHLYAPQARVLVTDDNNMNIKVAAGLLKTFGIVCDTAFSGAETIAMMREKTYDIVFLDHMMPKMDGLETLAELKRQNIVSDAKIVVLTANAIVGAEENYCKAGFDDYLSKPIDIGLLEQILEKYLPKEMVSYQSNEKKMEEKNKKQEEAAENKNKEIPKVEGYSQEEVKRIIKECPELNLALGLSYCMNMRDFYESILSEYIKEDKEVRLAEFYDAEDWDNYRILVHSLKSTSLSIGLEKLSENAKALEMAAKSADVEYIKKNHEAVMEEYVSTKKALQNLLTPTS